MSSELVEVGAIGRGTVASKEQEWRSDRKSGWVIGVIGSDNRREWVRRGGSDTMSARAGCDGPDRHRENTSRRERKDVVSAWDKRP